MLTIRSEQMTAFERGMFQEFEEEMLVHLQSFVPRLFEIRGEEAFRQVIHLGLDRGSGYGLSLRGPLRFYIECMVTLGCEFDTDPQFPWALETFGREGVEEMERAEEAHLALTAFDAATIGSDGASGLRALRGLRDWKAGLAVALPDLPDALAELYPERADYVGRDALQILIDQAFASTLAYGLAQEGTVLLAGLMFALGHGITRDPLYPWVQNTLSPGPTDELDTRVERLFKKSRTYLDATLSYYEALGSAEVAG